MAIKLYAQLSRRWQTIEIGGNREQLIHDLRDMKETGVLTDDDYVTIYGVITETGERTAILPEEEECIRREAGL